MDAREESSKIGLSSVFQLLEQTHDGHWHREAGKPGGELGKMEDLFPSFEIVEFYLHADKKGEAVEAA